MPETDPSEAALQRIATRIDNYLRWERNEEQNQDMSQKARDLLESTLRRRLKPASMDEADLGAAVQRLMNQVDHYLHCALDHAYAHESPAVARRALESAIRKELERVSATVRRLEQAQRTTKAPAALDIPMSTTISAFIRRMNLFAKSAPSKRNFDDCDSDFAELV